MNSGRSEIEFPNLDIRFPNLEIKFPNLEIRFPSLGRKFHRSEILDAFEKCNYWPAAKNPALMDRIGEIAYPFCSCLTRNLEQ